MKAAPMRHRGMGYYCPGNCVGSRMCYMWKMAMLNHVQQVNIRVQLEIRDFCNTLPQLLYSNFAPPNSNRYSPSGAQADSFSYFNVLNTDIFSFPVCEQRAENTSLKLQDIVTLLHRVRIAASMDTVNKSFHFSVVSNIGTQSRELRNQLYSGSTPSNKSE